MRTGRPMAIYVYACVALCEACGAVLCRPTEHFLRRVKLAVQTILGALLLPGDESFSAGPATHGSLLGAFPRQAGANRNRRPAKVSTSGPCGLSKTSLLVTNMPANTSPVGVGVPAAKRRATGP